MTYSAPASRLGRSVLSCCWLCAIPYIVWNTLLLIQWVIVYCSLSPRPHSFTTTALACCCMMLLCAYGTLTLAMPSLLTPSIIFTPLTLAFTTRCVILMVRLPVHATPTLLWYIIFHHSLSPSSALAAAVVCSTVPLLSSSVYPYHYITHHSMTYSAPASRLGRSVLSCCWLCGPLYVGVDPLIIALFNVRATHYIYCMCILWYTPGTCVILYCIINIYTLLMYVCVWYNIFIDTQGTLQVAMRIARKVK